MRLLVRDQQFSSRGLTGLYVGALSTIALLALLGQIFIQFSLQQQSSDAAVINIAGRQRMLSQKLTKASLALFVATNVAERDARVKEINSAQVLWVSSAAGLQHGNVQMNLPDSSSDAIKQLFTHIQPNFQAMLTDITNLLSIVKQDQAQPIATLHKDILPPIQDMLVQEPGFLTGMNNIVSQYQLESEGHVNQLKLVELVLFSLTLIVLCCEGFLVFKPAVGRLHKSVAALVQAEQKAAQHLEELERKNIDLEVAFAEAMAVHRKVVPHARVVTLGHYQVQGLHDKYYNVSSRVVEGNLLLECECIMYSRNLICTHSLAAASMHSALMRHQSRHQLQQGGGSSSSANYGTSSGR